MDESRLIYKKIIDSELPIEAAEWSRLTVNRNTHNVANIAWHTFIIIRLNGKQIYRKRDINFEIDKPLARFGNRLIKIGTDRAKELYVIKPE